MAKMRIKISRSLKNRQRVASSAFKMSWAVELTKSFIKVSTTILALKLHGIKLV